MKFVTYVKELSLAQLQAMADGTMQNVVSDVDFLETLAAHRCLIIPPWVMCAEPSGNLVRVVQLVYDNAGNLDKPRVLVEAAKEFRRAKQRGIDFGPRFST